LDPIEGVTGDTTNVVATLRQHIVSGRLAAGERLAEIPVAESLGVSRTPVRLAFRSLEQEGLLEKTGKRGFVVRRFSEADVRAAIEVRGLLEGLAARHLAERGMSAAVRDALALSISEGEAVLAKGHLAVEDIARWSRLNRRFHDALVHSHESHVIADAIARNNHLPFASADSTYCTKASGVSTGGSRSPPYAKKKLLDTSSNSPALPPLTQGLKSRTSTPSCQIFTP
jgi:GntR family transcriptional regulator of vanillate catabolism